MFLMTSDPGPILYRLADKLSATYWQKIAVIRIKTSPISKR